MQYELAAELANHYDHDSHGWWWVGGIFRVLFLVLIVVLIVRIFVWRRRGFGPGRGWGMHSAYSVLAERYAKGEIDAAEYHERLANLNQRPPKNKQ